MSWVTLLGYAASATVLATFCMNTMIPLRVIALVSNVLFMAYGFADQLYPVLLLHAILLPVNALRLLQFYRLVREMREAPRKDLSVQTLLPYMTRRKFSVGQALVRKGERADRLYYLVDGEIEVVEFSKVKQLYFQDRSFGFAVLQLIIARLVEDTERLMQAGSANLADFDIVVNSAAPAA